MCVCVCVCASKNNDIYILWIFIYVKVKLSFISFKENNVDKILLEADNNIQYAYNTVSR